MKTLLVPLDGSELAEQVLPYAQQLASLLNMRVRLLQVVGDVEQDWVVAESMTALAGINSPLAMAPDPVITTQAMRERAVNYLASQTMLFRDTEIRVAIDVRIGHAADVIVAAAAEPEVALVVMGTHGYSGLRRWTLGSVADKVVQATSTPVLLIRGGFQPTLSEISFQRIMVPLDGSVLADQALPLATELARRTSSNLTLLRVVPPTLELYPVLSHPDEPPSRGALLTLLQERASDELADIADRLRYKGVQTATVVELGQPADVIIDEATQRGIDLIVMATHGYGGLRRWAVGSVADKVLHATTTPLLLVRSRKDERREKTYYIDG